MYKFCPYCAGSLYRLYESSFKCQSCQKSLYLNSKPTAGIIPVYQDQMLLAVRAVEPAKGKLDAIGGFLNNGEAPKHGAVRELFEETGLKIAEEELKFIGITIDNYQFQGAKTYTFNTFYKLECQEKLDLVPADDVAELRWVKIDDEIDWGFESLKQIPGLLAEKQA